jgi:hypothetical protein
MLLQEGTSHDPYIAKQRNAPGSIIDEHSSALSRAGTFLG